MCSGDGLHTSRPHFVRIAENGENSRAAKGAALGICNLDLFVHAKWIKNLLSLTSEPCSHIAYNDYIVVWLFSAWQKNLGGNKPF